MGRVAVVFVEKLAHVLPFLRDITGRGEEDVVLIEWARGDSHGERSSQSLVALSGIKTTHVCRETIDLDDLRDSGTRRRAVRRALARLGGSLVLSRHRIAVWRIVYQAPSVTASM